jgi:hypothetical protein
VFVVPPVIELNDPAVNDPHDDVTFVLAFETLDIVDFFLFETFIPLLFFLL